MSNCISSSQKYNYYTAVRYKHSDNDDVYRQCICQVCEVDDYQHDEIMKTINEVYQTWKDHIDFQIIMEFAKKSFREPEPQYALMYLFAWDHFEDLHSCLQDLFFNKKISYIKLEKYKKRDSLTNDVFC